MRILHRKISMLLAIGMTFWLSGCYAIIDDCIECENSIMNNCRARRAWYQHYSLFDDIEYRSHFKKGFLDGYVNTAANGGTASGGSCQNEQCLPLMPPRCYWKHCYQDCEGRQKIDAWYQGYAEGAVAATDDGVYESSIIPTYGLQNGMYNPGASHTSTLEEDLYHDEHNQLVPEPEQALPNSEGPLPVPRTYDDLPKVPPADETTSLDEPVSEASYEFDRRDYDPKWATQPPPARVTDHAHYQKTQAPPIDQQIPKARFIEATGTGSAAARPRWETSGKFVLPVGYEGSRAPEWSEGAGRE